MELGLKTGVKAPDWAEDRGRHSEEPPQGLVMQPYEPWELGLDLVSSVATPSICCLHTALWGGRPLGRSVGHARLSLCGLAAVAQGALLSGCVWEYREPELGWGQGGLSQFLITASLGKTAPQEMVGTPGT